MRRINETLFSDRAHEHTGVAGGDLRAELRARVGGLEVDVDVDVTRSDVDGGAIVDGEAALEVAVAEVDFRGAFVAGGDVGDLEGNIALGDVDVRVVAGVGEFSLEAAVGDGDLGVVGVDGAGLDEALGDADFEGADFERGGEVAVVDHVAGDVDLELGEAEFADDLGWDLDLG